jgi:aspartate/methionine/tyrosine aminotransferase
MCAWTYYQSDPFSAEANKTGVISLAYAENKLLWKLLQRFYGPPLLRDDSFYEYAYGSEALRSAFASLLQRLAPESPRIRADDLVCGAGALSVMENVFHCLFEKGDRIGTITPHYHNADLLLRSRVQLELVLFERMVHMIEAVRKREIKGVLFINPNNPCGTVFPAERVEALVNACCEAGVHLIADEVYSFCTFYGAPSIKSVLTMQNVTSFSRYIHCVNGLAKLGFSGCRIGVLWSLNRQLIAVMRELTKLSPVSSPSITIATRFLACPEAEMTNVFGLQSSFPRGHLSRYCGAVAARIHSLSLG